MSSILGGYELSYIPWSMAAVASVKLNLKSTHAVGE